MKAVLAGLALAASAFMFAAAGLATVAAFAGLASLGALALGIHQLTRKDHRP
ncbi:hypothetical protein [Acrocarpospora sp. B8E8]|uniref:hypothetical protein n=1 Tax=Acrocarpospora sp. B8E8 TaxID=3153572 RepID=UPI00325D84D5